MNNAIKQAIEGGWNMLGFADKPLMTWAIDKYYKGFLVSVQYAKHDIVGCDKTMTIKGQRNDFDIKEALLDPKFWKALGKAEGWVGVKDMTYFPKTEEEIMVIAPIWKIQMHRFIDHLIAEKPIDDFFNNLLK